ncbi:glycerophosphocholine cholinephosphodiesterase ENPP6-like isoform X2 [Tubulanus polymorphus]|uniref:glycerophosphocholine cholinephosphodiesterase ENPP6-like isoform X2 n=1 Tax=Tubulanus polymorphus TaxID=672921 RepID=UPI003DA5B25B
MILSLGLHVESHGMVGNSIYDPKHGTTFRGAKDDEQLNPYWWNGGEPFWVTATKQSRVCAMYYWGGCQVEIRGFRPQYCRRLQSEPDISEFHRSIDHAVYQLHTDRVDFTAIYVELPDTQGHKFGPLSKELNDSMRTVDKEIQYLLRSLDETGLNKSTNVIIVSDHGMADIGGDNSKDIKMTDFVPDIESLMERFIDHSYGVLIWPKPGVTEQIYNGFKGKHKHMHIFHKNEIPEIWHFQNNDRIPPLLLVTEPGWTIVKGFGENPGIRKYEDVGRPHGTHGYDPTDKSMYAIFLAFGPDIKHGTEVGNFPNTDVYNLLCKLLKIIPSPNNGTWSNVAGILVNDTPKGWVYEQPRLEPSFSDWVIQPPLIEQNVTSTILMIMSIIVGIALTLTTAVFCVGPRKVCWCLRKHTESKMRYSEVLKSVHSSDSEDSLS